MMECRSPSGNLVTDVNLWQSLLKIVQPDLIARRVDCRTEFFSSENVEEMSRGQLIDYVTALRRLAGQTTEVKALIPGYDPNKLGVKVAATTEASGVVVNPSPTPDPMQMMMLFFKQQEDIRKEKK
jgi:hypothetical protein